MFDISLSPSALVSNVRSYTQWEALTTYRDDYTELTHGGQYASPCMVLAK